jgi:hypothetical protein
VAKRFSWKVRVDPMWSTSPVLPPNRDLSGFRNRIF